MKINKTLLSIVVIAITSISFISPPKKARKIKPGEVRKVMQKVADWQILHVNDFYSGRDQPLLERWRTISRKFPGDPGNNPSSMA